MARTDDVAARNNAALPIAAMRTFLPQPKRALAAAIIVQLHCNLPD
jgi:hypothetical protein